MPSNSNLIKWAEQGRLHVKYQNCTSAGVLNALTGVWTIPSPWPNFNPALANGSSAALRVGQTLMISDRTPGSTLTNKGVITVAPTSGGNGANQVTIAYYEAAGQAMVAGVACDIFIYGSEFNK